MRYHKAAVSISSTAFLAAIEFTPSASSPRLRALFAAASTVFERLNAIQYDAPWKHEPAIGGVGERR